MSGFGARSLSITFQFDDQPYQRTFPGVIAQMEDLSPVFERLGTEFRSHMFEVFVTEGKANGSEWVPLNPRYAAWKAKHYPGQTKLTAMGRLAQALAFRTAFGNITWISAREAVFGASRRTPDGKWDLGLIHNRGSKKRKIPARQILKLTPKLRARFTRVLKEFMNTEPAGGWR